MRIRMLAALAAALAFGGAAIAQPAKAEPTIELRLRSVDDLLNKAEYATGLAGQEDVIKQVRELLKALSADGKGIEGVDPKKPFGLTATITPGVVDSEFMVMVPIADQDRFLKLLEERLQLTPEKVDAAKDDLFKVPAPVITEAYLRFAGGYVYVGRTKEAVEPKALPDLKAFFGKDDGAIGSAVVHLDRIPPVLKTLAIGQIEAGLNEQLQQPGGPPEAIVKPVGENILAAIKSFLEDSKTLTAKVYVDEKADDLSAEITLTARPGTVFAKNLAGLGGKSSLPAGIVGTGSGAARLTVKGALPEGVKKDLDKVVDAAFAEALIGVDEGAKPVVEKIFKTLAPTLKAGELDLAIGLSAADAKGAHTLIAALGVKKGKDIEKLVKDLEKEFGGFIAEAVTFDFDVETIGAFTLHKVTVKALPPEIEKVFGGNKVWIATSEDCLAVSVEPEGKAIKAGLKAKAVPVPVVSVDVAFAKLVPLIAQAGNLKEDEVKAMLKDAFGGAEPTGKDTLTLNVTGGDQLTVKGKLKGAAVRLIAGFALMGRKID